jgi:hypothetical protein
MKPTKEHFAYLDALRASGVTNMFGARPYLAKEFSLERLDATTILSAWMQTFDEKMTVEERLAKLEEGSHAKNG